MKVEIGNLKMAREALCASSFSLSETYKDKDRVKEFVGFVERIIKEIDILRPLGSDGKHGDLHTPWCGCEDSPFKFCEGCERVIIFNESTKRWTHEHSGEVFCFKYIRTTSIARPMLMIEQ